MLAHKISLRPNRVQSTYFAKACGVARFAYNWGLAEWTRQYSSGLRPSERKLRKQLNSIKRNKFPWMLEVTKNAPQMAIIHLGEAFKNYFAGRAKYPKFKKKGIHDSFTLTNDQFLIAGRRIRIPNLGWVRMNEELRFNGKVMSATISRTADRWFVSVNVDTQITRPISENQAVVGVDLGVNRLATLSNGKMIEGPKPRRLLLNRLRRLSRSMVRKTKGSQNRKKAQIKLSRLHARIANIRRHELHRLTTHLVTNYGTVVIEDLNVRGMMANRHLAGSIGDMGLYEFRRQLAYKTAMRGTELIVADRFFPSSKLCSVCGVKRESLPLSVRTWTCASCGTIHDRDLNAAKNLMNLAGSSSVTACGEEGSGTGN